MGMNDGLAFLSLQEPFVLRTIQRISSKHQGTKREEAEPGGNNPITSSSFLNLFRVFESKYHLIFITRKHYGKRKRYSGQTTMIFTYHLRDSSQAGVETEHTTLTCWTIHNMDRITCFFFRKASLTCASPYKTKIREFCAGL